MYKQDSSGNMHITYLQEMKKARHGRADGTVIADECVLVIF